MNICSLLSYFKILQPCARNCHQASKQVRARRVCIQLLAVSIIRYPVYAFVYDRAIRHRRGRDRLQHRRFFISFFFYFFSPGAEIFISRQSSTTASIDRARNNDWALLLYLHEKWKAWSFVILKAKYKENQNEIFEKTSRNELGTLFKTKTSYNIFVSCCAIYKYLEI